MTGFVDEAQLNVRGGDGGAGCVSFRREGPEVRGGPNGGDGGAGGDVWLVADRNVASLLAFRDHPHRRAASGVHGKGKDQHGAAGKDLTITVPEGTVVRDLYTGEALADLVSHGDRWLAAAGGRGGRGNAKFLSNRRRAPSFAEQGETGEERWLKLELKLMADVALVGVPNAGKSTLISRISAAKPKIADYPFTTLEPHLGVVRLGDDTEYVVADIPGLIEGASEGKGLGHRFLRHIERARVLCVLVDLAPVDGMTPGTQEAVLHRELEAYRPDLLDRPRIVVGTKADVATEPWDGPRISAVTGAGVAELTGALGDLVGRGSRRAARRRRLVRHPPARPRGRDGRAPRRRRVPRPRPRRAPGGGVVRHHQHRRPRLRRCSTQEARRRQGLGPSRGPQRRRGLGRRLQLRLRGRRLMSTVVAKIGSSSLTDERGVIDLGAVVKLCQEVVALRAEGHKVVVVSSGAVSAGVAALGLATRPSDLPTLQALSAAGQSRLMQVYNDILGHYGVVGAQVLLDAKSFVDRRRYLHARQTLIRLLELGCVPVVNENDAIAPDEIRFGDNDRIAALVSHLVAADVLVLLTDTPGLFTADPRVDGGATLIEEVAADDPVLADAGGTGSVRGSGGMASKLAAARIASWSGVQAVIAKASRPNVLADAVAGARGVGTTFRAHDRRLPARKLWIAFATGAAGTVVVDDGARRALVERGTSLLPAGVRFVQGAFDEGDAVDVAGPEGDVFARGMVAIDADTLRGVAGRRSSELPPDVRHEAIHRDDLVVLPR